MVDRESGSNSLRGGKNIFAAKTKVGNWVEEEYKPGVPTRGFSTRRFITTTAHQQLEGCGRSVTEAENFGAGVAPGQPADRFNYADIINPDTTQHAGKWQTVTKSVHLGPKDAAQTEFSTTFKLKGGLADRETLNKYREDWTSDTPVGAAMRFKTSSNTAAADCATPQFRSKTLRKLPGTPLAVEQLRIKLADQRGFSAIADIKKEFRGLDSSGDGVLQREELRLGLKNVGVSLSEADFDAIFKFFDKSGDGTVSLDEFATCLRGRMSQARIDVVKECFAKLDATGDGVIRTDDLKQFYDLSKHPDYTSRAVSEEAALSALIEQWDLYESDGTVTLDDFLEYYHDLGSSIDDDVYFEWMLRSAWKIGPGSYVATDSKAFKEHQGTEKGF